MAASSSPANLRRQIQAATWRFRWERLAKFSLVPGWIFCGFLLLWLAAACVSPPLFGGAVFALIFAFVMALFPAVVIFAMKVETRAVQAKMDAAAQWPDSIQSAANWPENEATEWHRLQQEQTSALMQGQSWKKGWPLRWPRLAWVPGVGAGVLALLLLLGQAQWREAKARSELAAGMSTDLQDRKEMLEEIFKDWDQAQKEEPDPDLEALLKEIQPLRDKLAEGKISEKEVFLEMNKIEDRLKAMQAKLDQQSLEPLAADLAAALEPIDAASALAAALKRKDFESAMAQAKKAGEQFQKNETKMPSGEQAETASNRMGALAKKAQQENQDQLSKAMQQMQQGLKENNSEKMSQGMSKLSQSLAGQSNSQSQSQKKSLNTQMAQMNAAKNGSGKGQGQGISTGPPKLSLAKSKDPSKGAGTETDPNRFGAGTQLEATRNQVGLNGAMGEGNSEVRTESSEVPVLEERAGGVTAQQFAAYEKLSKQAADDESLPLAYRETIKRYFENIRPRQAP